MNITPLPMNGFAPNNKAIAEHLREQAAWIESSDTQLRNVILVIEQIDGTVRRQLCGAPCDLATCAGLLMIAAIQLSVED